MGTLRLPALSENTGATAQLRGRDEEEEVDGHGDCRATRTPAGVQMDKCEQRMMSNREERGREGGKEGERQRERERETRREVLSTS